MTRARTLTFRLRPLLLALAIAATVAAPAQVGATSLHDFLKPPKPLDAETAREKRKSAARAEAEKQRAIRAAREKDAVSDSTSSAAARKPGDLSDADDLYDESPATHKTAPAAAAPAPAVRYNSQASMAIEEGVRRMGFPPESAAQVAGLMIGVAGQAGFSHLMPGQSGGDALDLMSQDAALPNTDALENAYAGAEQVGEYLRYGFLAAAAGGVLLLVLRRILQRAGTRSRPHVNSEERNSMSRFSLSRLLGKRRAEPASEADSGVEPISVDLAMIQDYAVNLLFARGRHDLTGCRDMVTPNLAGILERYFRTCESRGHWNKVERVSNLKCQQQDTWTDGENQFAKLHVQWQALDYVVNFNRKPQDPGYVYEGNPGRLDEFSEDWTVVRRPGEGWLIDVMCPAVAAAR